MPVIEYEGQEVEFPDEMPLQDIADVMNDFHHISMMIAEPMLAMGGAAIGEILGGWEALEHGGGEGSEKRKKEVEEFWAYRPKTEGGRQGIEAVASLVQSAVKRASEFTDMANPENIKGYWEKEVIPALQEYAGPVGGSILGAGTLGAMAFITEAGGIGKTKHITRMGRMEEGAIKFSEPFSQEAIDFVERQVGARGTKGTIVYMSPNEFLDMAEWTIGDKDKIKALREVRESGGKFKDIPFLSFTHDGKGLARVTGHEGRHRAMRLRGEGVERMPVVLQANDWGEGRGIRWDRSIDPADDYYYIPPEEWPRILKSQDNLFEREIRFPESALPEHRRNDLEANAGANNGDS